MDAGGAAHDNEKTTDETQFKEVAQFQICLKDGQYGMWVQKDV